MTSQRNSDSDGDLNCYADNPLHTSHERAQSCEALPALNRFTTHSSSVEGSPPPLSADPSAGTPTTHHRHLVLEYEDVYDGDVIVERGAFIPHGHGRLQSTSGKHCYIGDFVHRWRDGYGTLRTERYVLWSRWRMNRPDLTNSARVDFANGDRYCGFLKATQETAMASLLSLTASVRLSKFSMWAQSLRLVRQRWGELVTAGGDRFFGEWEDDQPNGFGCYLTATGDRYVGRFRDGKFHDTGTLFSLTYGRGEGGTPLSGIRSVSSTPSHPSRELCLSRSQWSGAVFDGVWVEGRFQGEGHLTLPCGARVSAMWKGATQPYEGELVVPPSAQSAASTAAYTWRECFHWEPLLCGSSEEARHQAHQLSATAREAVHRATSLERVRTTLMDFLNGDAAIHNALKIFRRCFFFLHGTCGRNSERGGGGRCNRLGWCYLRNAFGGCVHSARGTPISGADLDLALLDVLSLVRSVQRWAAEMLDLGPDATEVVLQDAGWEAWVGRWCVDQVLREVYDVLLNLYSQVYRREEAVLARAMERLRGRVTLDDLGVDFARAEAEEKLFDPYTDAIHCIEQTQQGGQTLSGLLRVLLQWSKEIDLSTRLAQVHFEDAAPVGQRGATSTGKRAFQCGSADDLLPIHQYVLSQATTPHLFAVSRLLGDFAGEASFVDPTSQESFCVTTLQVCVMMLPQLHPLHRDSPGDTLIPTSMIADRMCEAVAQVPRLVARARRQLRLRLAEKAHVVADGDRCDGLYHGTDAQLVAVVRGYARSWVPHVMAQLSHAATVAAVSVSETKHSVNHPLGSRVVHLDAAAFSRSVTWVVPLNEKCPGEAQLVSFLFAGRLFGTLGVGLRWARGADGSTCSLQSEEDLLRVLLDSQNEPPQMAPPPLSEWEVCLPRPTLPCFFSCMAEKLLTLLS